MTLRTEERVCPLCGEDNNCKHGQMDCWCNNIEVPKYIIDMIPKDKRGKACVCKACIERYKKD